MEKELKEITQIPKDNCAIHPTMPAATQQLYAFLEQVEKTKTLTIIFGVALIGGGFAFHYPSPEAGIALVLCLLACTQYGIWQYRKNRRSVRAIYLMQDMAGGVIAVLMGWLGWVTSMITSAHDIYVNYLPQICTVVIIIFLCELYSYSQSWPRLMRQFNTMAAYRTEGKIPAQVMYDLLSFNGQSNRISMKMPYYTGLGSSISLVLVHNLNIDFLHVLYFTIFVFGMLPLLFAMLVARRVWQRRYLGNDDLIIVD